MSELVVRTEGWVGGLQMAALAMRDHTDIPAFIAAFTGSNRYVMDYLAEEVLARQPETERTFLLQTSILDRMCSSLCEAVTGHFDSQEILERLEHANLFFESAGRCPRLVPVPPALRRCVEPAPAPRATGSRLGAAPEGQCVV